MRFAAWLVALSLGVGIVEGAPRDSVRETEVADRSAAIKTEIPHERLATQFVNVRVYGLADFSAGTQRATLDVAEATFRAASVDVIWKVCPAECDVPLSPNELLVRLVPSPTGVPLDSRCLGDALIDAEKHTGVLATVYIDRVRRLARELRIDQGVLLGHTLAHEIGHLLLATNKHGASGLMREIWSSKELRGRRANDWLLHSFDAAAIRQRLARASSNPSPGAS
jgi:hypothetical protein